MAARIGVAWQRAAILAGCGALALLAIGSGLDRSTTQSPARAARVPGIFAVRALAARTQQSLQTGNYVAANLLAERFVRKDPVTPESTALLGAARFAAGDLDGADRAFRVAGNLGWRTGSTQYYWLWEALKTQDFGVAAQRLDALFRQDLALAADAAMLAPFEQDVRGRDALVGRLAHGPAWLSDYFGNVYNLDTAIALRRAAVLRDLAARGMRLGCAGVGPLTRKLVAAGRILDAHGLWRMHCPAASQGLVADASFNGLASGKLDGPFAWTVLGSGDVSIDVGPATPGSGSHLVLASSAGFGRRVLMQLVVAQPGRYALTWRARDEQGRGSSRIAASFGCRADSREWVQADLDSAGRSTAIVDARSDCGGSWLGFTLQPGNGRITLDRIALQRVN